MPLAKQRYDLKIENFDRIFDLHVRAMTQEQKDLLPQDILFKLFTNTSKPASEKLNFYQKWFVLFRCFKRQMYVVVESDTHGLGLQDYLVFKSKQDKKEYDEDAVNALDESGTFVVGNEELIDSISYLNKLSISPAYNYSLKIKNNSKKQYTNILKEVAFISNFLIQYEGNKKRMVKQGTPLSDLYVLLYLFDGIERGSGETYKNIFKGAMGASRVQMLRSFKNLTGKDYIVKLGSNRRTVYRITALGKQYLYETMRKFILP